MCAQGLQQSMFHAHHAFMALPATKLNQDQLGEQIHRTLTRRTQCQLLIHRHCGGRQQPQQQRVEERRIKGNRLAKIGPVCVGGGAAASDGQCIGRSLPLC